MFSSSIDQPMLDALRKCDVLLHLTGSRFFGGYTEKSDYDFFCRDTQENYETISSLGSWIKEEMTLDSVTYNDHNTSEVWVHWGVPNIHIQFVKDVDMKLKVQKFLIGFPFHYIPDKRVRKYIWNWAYRVTPKV